MSTDNHACSTCGQLGCPGGPLSKGICPQKRTPRQEFFQYFIEQRGVEDPCTKCQGMGTRTYGSTSTWRGGMGGASMTTDVCDHCWGSGDENRKWVDLRALRNAEDSRVAARATTFLSDRCGFGMSVLNPGLDELATELEKFEKQRRPRPQGFDTVSRCLAKALRDMAAASRKEEDARRRCAAEKKT